MRFPARPPFVPLPHGNVGEAMKGSIAPIAAAAVIVLGSLSPADAAGQPGAVDTSLSDAEMDRRIDFIERQLDASKLHAQIWYWSWMTINVGATVGLSVGSALTDDGDTRASFIPQAVLAALGVADLTVFRPLEARFGAEPIENLPQDTRAQRLAKLERAEALLRGNAERAKRAQVVAAASCELRSQRRRGRGHLCHRHDQRCPDLVRLGLGGRRDLHLERARRPGARLAGLSALQDARLGVDRPPPLGGTGRRPHRPQATVVAPEPTGCTYLELAARCGALPGRLIAAYRGLRRTRSDAGRLNGRCRRAAARLLADRRREPSWRKVAY